MVTTTGRVVHWARQYDLLVWLVMFGREGAFRSKVLTHARVQPGEAILDVGCGTGTLAIAAKRRVGSAGTVTGVDASPEMIARAREKARRADVSVEFTNGVAEALSFADAQFDVVLSTVMLHHLPRPAREACAREMRRVLKPGGRVLAVDFGAAQDRRSIIGHFHHRHGHVTREDIVSLLTDAGLHVLESGAVGMAGLQYVLATTPE